MYKSISVFIFVVLCCFVGICNASAADVYISAMETKLSTLSVGEKTQYIKRTFALLHLQALRLHHNQQQLAFVNQLKEYTKNQLASVSTMTSSSIEPIGTSTSIVSLSMELPNIDINRVRDVWIQRHNEERSSVGLGSLRYHFALESTSQTRANYLARIKTTTHRRNSTDPYYSYSIIKQWFLDQGIVFVGKEQGGQSLFTENIGWNIYSCKKTDCTDDFIAAIKKSRTFFMSEKGKSYKPHYNAIVGNYTNIGLGVAFAGNRYYLVSHYSQDLQ